MADTATGKRQGFRASLCATLYPAWHSRGPPDGCAVKSRIGTVMTAIEDLIRQIADPRLRDHLAAEVAKLKNQKIVFEDHLPELLRLPKAAATVGARVVRKDHKNNVTYRVAAEVNGKWIKAVPQSGGPDEKLERSAFIVVKAFGEAMYPALIPVDAIERAPGKSWHILINADNTAPTFGVRFAVSV